MKKNNMDRVLGPVGMILSVLVVLVFVLSLTGQDKQSNAEFTDVSAAVIETLDLSEMQEADNQMIKRLYGLTPSDYAGICVWYPPTNMGAEEVLIVQLNDMSQQEAVAAAAQARLDTQMNTFEGYGVEQVALLEKAVIEVRGNYILFVCNDNVDDAVRAFLDAL